MKTSDDVYIVAGGPSLKGLSFEKLREKDTIAVNVSVFDVPDPNWFITCDYSFLMKIRHRWKEFRASSATKVFVANMCHPFLKDAAGRIVDTRFNLVYDLAMFDIVVKSHHQDGIGMRWKDFATGLNSGYCALQLAVLRGYKRIHLLGIDLCVHNATHYHDQYGRKNFQKFSEELKKYQAYFTSAIRQLNAETDIQVINCSPLSPLFKMLPYVPYSEILT